MCVNDDQAALKTAWRASTIRVSLRACSPPPTPTTTIPVATGVRRELPPLLRGPQQHHPIAAGNARAAGAMAIVLSQLPDARRCHVDTASLQCSIGAARDGTLPLAAHPLAERTDRTARARRASVGGSS